jgi:hypothetical protein
MEAPPREDAALNEIALDAVLDDVADRFIQTPHRLNRELSEVVHFGQYAPEVFVFDLVTLFLQSCS